MALLSLFELELLIYHAAFYIFMPNSHTVSVAKNSHAETLRVLGLDLQKKSLTDFCYYSAVVEYHHLTLKSYRDISSSVVSQLAIVTDV